MKLIPNAIYKSYSLRQHARNEYIYTWEIEGKLVANNAYYHNDFAKIFGSYEYGYDIKLLEKIEDLEFIGMIDDFEPINKQDSKKYKSEDVLYIPMGMRSEVYYKKKNAKYDLDEIKLLIARRLETNGYKLKRAKEELEIIKQWKNLIDSDEEWILNMYEDSDMIFNLDYFRQTSRFKEYVR